MSGSTVLTRDLVRRYRLGEKDILNLQFYLGKAMVVQGRSGQYTKSTRSHRLDRTERLLTEKVVIPQRTPGRAVKFWEYRRWWSQRSTLYIQVCFEQKRNLCLTFATDESGAFRLRSVSSASGGRYRCLEGCSGNYLVVPGRLVSSLRRRERVARGWRF
jgi:hypothetical protein